MKTRCISSAACCAAMMTVALCQQTLQAEITVHRSSYASTAADARYPGKFIWADLVTDDLASVKSFYSSMFGWKFQSVGPRLLATNQGKPVAGVIQRDRPPNHPNATPRWFGYISVTDVEHARKSILQSGGKLVAAPHEIPTRGKQAIFTDPEGALFGVIRSNSADPADGTAAPGDWIWLQLLSRNAGKAALFYQNIGGYRIQRNQAENRSSDYLLSSEGITRATIRNIRPDRTDVKPTWLPFVRVTRIEKSVSKAKQLGGSLLVSPRPDLMNGKVAVIADPTGAAIGLLEWNP